MGLKQLLATGATLAFFASAAAADPADQPIDPTTAPEHGGGRWEVSLVKDLLPGDGIDPGIGSSGMDGSCPFYKYNGELYFLGNGRDTSRHFLYKVNKNGKVVRVLRFAYTGWCRDRVVYRGEFYFAAQLPNGIGQELYKVKKDGTVVLVKDINPGSAPSSPDGFTEYRDELYFTADGPGVGSELYKVTKNGDVVLVDDLDPGEEGSSTQRGSVFNGELYFHAGDKYTNLTPALFKVTPTGSVVRVADIESAYGFTPFKGELYFVGPGSAGHTALYKLTRDDRVVLVADVEAAFELIVYQNELYFPVYNYGEDILHKLDRNGNVVPITDVHFDPSASTGSEDTRASGFTFYRGEVYFGGYSPATGHGLYKIGKDGTVVLVSNIIPSTLRFAQYNGELYYPGYPGCCEDTVGQELFKVRRDGSVVLAADIFPGPNGSTGGPLMAYRGSLYLGAKASNIVGYELYRFGPAQH